jgi:hypothetical protein
MSRRRTAAALIFLGAISWTDYAGAWGPEGHAIIAEIAEARLSDQARAQLTQILAADESGAKHLDQIASWPDAVRPARPETAPWHFVDIPLDVGSYDGGRDCKQDNCVVAAIPRFAGVLGDSNADPKARVEALKFLVHFMGDIHQPLHCETDLAKFPAPEGDRGGNKVHLNYLGKPTNFHSLWDGGLIEDVLDIELGPHFTPDLQATAAEAAKLNAKIRAGDAAAWAPEGLSSDLGTATVDWANESHAFAQSAYRELPTPRHRGWEQAYRDQQWPVIETQLTRAGVRLARILNEKLR